ncbi:putative uncharacterized protein DDB_G0271982 isoform X1 [Dendropsophus ebraccatus]|uniref:putative uncharacterized protein DDB_G0271982 isoform X1 n=1 Tax=Dendropsophus ebraccatus TaxID=150705 RepID=UPI0038320A74
MLDMKSAESVLLSVDDNKPWIEDEDEGPDETWISAVRSAPQVFCDGYIEKNIWVPRLQPIREESKRDFERELKPESKMERFARKKEERVKLLAMEKIMLEKQREAERQMESRMQREAQMNEERERRLAMEKIMLEKQREAERQMESRMQREAQKKEKRERRLAILRSIFCCCRRPAVVE